MILRAIIKALIMPPAINILLVILGLIIWRFHKKIGQSIVIGSLILLWLLSTPLVSQVLVDTLENDFLPLNIQDVKKELDNDGAINRKKSAVVVLGGGRYRSAAEYNGRDTVSIMSLNRLRYTANIAKQLELPILVAGGSVFSSEASEKHESEARLMQSVLQDEFGVSVKWLEESSRTTAENARNSIVILNDSGINTIVLVTHANHMPRAFTEFKKEFNLGDAADNKNEEKKIIAAPMGYFSIDDSSNVILALLPKASALLISRTAIHEWAGIFYYRFFE